MIQTHSLSKSFAKKGDRKKRVHAVSDVSFSAQDSCITGLLGPNGAGKSTTLRMLTTLVKPDAGTAVIDGFDVCLQAQQARQCIGFLPHSSGLYPRLTAIENIQYYADLCGLDKKTSQQRIDELIDWLDMASFCDRRTEGFSQGQKTKVALARALVHRPKTLILDEPTNGLDVMATRKLRAILSALKDQGHCVLLSSHVMQEISLLCDHVVIISEGQIAISGTIAEIQQKTACEDLEDAFVAAIQTLELAES